MGQIDRKPPVVIGIVGDSAAGKTTMAAGLVRALGSERTVCICTDDYHRFSRKQRAERGLTPHDADCNYMDILEQHVALLRDGQPILKPVYNHNGGVLDPPEYVEPKSFIILEGLLGYATPALREAYDVKLYLEPQEPLRLKWKFQRDVGHSGYTVEQVMAALDKLNTDSARFVCPQRAYADMVVGFYPPAERPDEAGAGLNVRHILRPTLPYLDLAPLLEMGADTGFLLELARDIDGRPVDALHILGSIDDRQATAMEALLWNQIPDAPAVRAGLGQFTDGEDRQRFSRSLALSQLLITHFLVNAALGHHVP
ncbi:MAG: phosphoribulokinase [Rhodospirillales bacterium]